MAQKPKKKRLTPAQQKNLVMMAGKCLECGLTDIRLLQVHHINPLAKGGSNVQRNLSVLCPTCHKKADRHQLTPPSLTSLANKVTGVERPSPALVKVFTDLRKLVKRWSELRWSGFQYEWKQLDESDFHLLSQIKKNSPDIYELCEKASHLFEDVASLRADVGALVREEQSRLAQEFRSNYDNDSQVAFSQFTITVDGGNQCPLYVEHAWAYGKNTQEWAEISAQERISNYKSWDLEVVVTGKRQGNSYTDSVAKGKEAVAFGDMILTFLGSQPNALKLREKLAETLELREALLPKLERELSKG